MLTIETIKEARERISSRIHRTPVITSRLFNDVAGKQVFFKSLHSSYKFVKQNFANTKEFISVAQKGSKASGFDRELSYELKELMQLRQMMMECQQRRECKRP